MDTDVLVSVVAPVHNAADVLEAFIRDTVAATAGSFSHYEIIVVDDGSSDDTAPIMQGLLTSFDHLRLVRLSRRFGIDAAISAGLELAIGDWTVVLDPATDPPSLIPELVGRARSSADMLFGVRDSPREDPWYLRAGAAVFYWYASRVIHLQLPRNSTHLRILSRKAVNALLQLHRRELYLRVLPLYIGFTSEPFVYKPIERRGGGHPRTFGELVNTAVALTIDNSSHPLRLVSVLALIASGLNVVYAAYVVIVYLFKRDTAEGWVTISLQSALQFFLLSLAVSALCEYTGRIFNRVGGQPSFHIMEEKSSAIELREERRNVVHTPAQPTRRVP
ncbi:MAG TPA: glycosyltransferase family 2 protein [Gemmatimonadaceae bacterium]|nr:glycosyltransferase family 2 protein [Gemmatimonadaceae bacterium]